MSRMYQDISALILEVGFVMNAVVMRIDLNTLEAYTCSLITFFIYSLVHLANIPIVSNGFPLPLQIVLLSCTQLLARCRVTVRAFY